MNERSIFEAALEIQDPAARHDYLDQSCEGDAALRSRVEALLAANQAVGEFLEVSFVDQALANDPTKAFVWSTIAEGLDGTILQPEVSDMNQAAQDKDVDVQNLDFLQPSTTPGSLGKVAHYEVLDVLGHGGYGIVLKAFDEKLQRLVAIKVLGAHLAATSPPRKRFLREARAGAKIRHENVVNIYSVEEQPIPFLVMEHIEGQTLQQKLAGSGPLEAPEILHLGRQIASGLAAAHAVGLIHRDIKPGNILLEQGAQQKVKITDFGLARAADDASLTQTGATAGTPLFMAPEQALGAVLDHRADLFSLGSVLYTMATGRPPFRAPTSLAVLKRVAEDTPRPIQEIIPEVPDWLCAIISKLHAKQPADRFASAGEVAELLERCQARLQQGGSLRSGTELVRQECQPGPGLVDGDSSAVTSRPLPPTAGPSRRRTGRMLAAALLVALLGGLGFTEATGVTQLATTVIRFTTGAGTLVIQTDDPSVKIMIDGEEVRISGSGVEEVLLRPGQYKFAAIKDGEPVIQQLVTITRGGRETVRATLETNAGIASLAAAGVGIAWPKDAPALATAPFTPAQARQSQEAWAKYLKVDLELTNSSGLTFRLIPPGDFLMGSSPAEIEDALRQIEGDTAHWKQCAHSESPPHKVALTQPVYLGVYEVTQKQFQELTGGNPSAFRSDGPGQAAIVDIDTADHPVDSVSWNDAVEFCNLLSRRDGLEPYYSRVGDVVTIVDGGGYRLPTEAEWEFACRGGTVTRYSSGDREQDLSAAGWFRANSGDRTHAVGESKANAFGLCGMHGNVWEWCSDRWEPAYYRQFRGRAAVNPRGPTTVGLPRVVRGGGWDFPAALCRSATRNASDPSFRAHNIGLRIARPVPGLPARN